MDKSIIAKALMCLGFELQKIDKVGYSFLYEEMKYLWLTTDKDDAGFLTINQAYLLNEKEWGREYLLEVANEINANFKYIKAYIYGGGLWLSYEREVHESEAADMNHLMDVIREMIWQLCRGTEHILEEHRKHTLQRSRSHSLTREEILDIPFHPCGEPEPDEDEDDEGFAEFRVPNDIDI